MRVIITGGGTGGHLYPGLAIAEALRAHRVDAAILFVGGDRVEARVVPEEGFPFRRIAAARKPRGLGLRSLASAAVMGYGLIQALWLVHRWRPDVVVATGGYVCVPVGFAAAMFGTPLVLQEQNLVPGLATRLLARWARCISVPHALVAERLPGRRSEVTGVPIRRRAREGDRARGLVRFGLEAGRFTILVIGGSQGALSLSRGVCRLADLLMYDARLQILHHTGASHLHWVRQAIGRREHVGPPALRHIAASFLDPIGDAYACADLVICRAGMSTLSEVTAWGLPVIAVPYPHATESHQEENAAMVVRSGAALRIGDEDLEGTALTDAVLGLLNDPAKRSAMAAASRALGRPHAADAVAAVVAAMGRCGVAQEARV